MTYDGAGSRVSQTASGATTPYLADALNPGGYAQVIEELIGGIVLTSSGIWFADNTAYRCMQFYVCNEEKF